MLYQQRWKIEEAFSRTDHFYPDFVAPLTDGRLLVIEYKGAYLTGNNTQEVAKSVIRRAKMTHTPVILADDEGNILYLDPDEAARQLSLDEAPV